MGAVRSLDDAAIVPLCLPQGRGDDAESRKGIPLSYLLLSVLGYPFIKKLGVAIGWSGYGDGVLLLQARHVQKAGESGKVAAKEMQQGREARLCGYRPGLAKALPGTTARVELGFLGKAGQLLIPTMLRVLMRWLADKLDKGERLQRPVTLYTGLPPLSFFTDAKAESDRAWIGVCCRNRKRSRVPDSP